MSDRDVTHTTSISDPAARTHPASSTEAAEVLPTVVGDRYQIVGRLGGGGMGVVYAARDIHLGRQVAIKVVASRRDSAIEQERLVREAQAMARLRHPNIATVYDIGASGARLFVVMELVDGGTVAEWLRARRRTWRQTVEMFLQAAHGLGAAHAAGFVHRDFKPENVLVGSDGVARVSDFGVARLLGDGEGNGTDETVAEGPTFTLTRGVVGTAGYIAPEILRHEPFDARADQFSFCVALYAALHGERPFETAAGSNRMLETLGALRRPARGAVPRWLRRILVRGLAAARSERWSSMGVLTAEIQRHLHRRRMAWIALTICAVAVAAAGVLLGISREPVTPPSWSPMVLGREEPGSPTAIVVSPDGSTLARMTVAEAWIEPRLGAGARHHVTFPFDGNILGCGLAHAGDRLSCVVAPGPGRFELWSIDVATGVPVRRLPSVAAPTVKPSYQLSVRRDDSVVFGVVDGTALMLADPKGAVETLLRGEPGQWLVNPEWSPDGGRIAFQIVSPGQARIAVMDARTRRVEIVSHRVCMLLVWLTDESLACAPRNFRRPVIVELLLGAGGALAEERIRYEGPEFQQVTTLSPSSSGLLLSTSPNDQHLAILDIERPGKARRVASGGINDLPVAGWTSSGRLIFGTSLQGRLRIMAMEPDGRIAVVRNGTASEVPLVVLDEAIIFGRFPGGESTVPFFELPVGRRYPPEGELFRLVPGSEPEALGKTSGFMAILCAGGRTTPCLIAERSGDDVTAFDWDPETGARGRQRGRWSVTSYSGVSALSPDGRTLAQVQRLLGLGQISLLDLDSGVRRNVAVPAGTALDYPRWEPDGSLLARGNGEVGTGIIRIRGSHLELVGAVPAVDEPSSAAYEFQIAPDGKSAAILMADYLSTFAWVDRAQY